MDTEHMNEQELATYWGMSPKTLQRWRTLRKGPEYIKFGKSVRYPLTAVVVYQTNNSIRTRAASAAAGHAAAPAPAEELTLTPEQESLLKRMRSFLASSRSDPARPRA